MVLSIEQVDNALRAATAARQLGDGVEERRILNEALRIAPQDPRVLNAAGMAALSIKDFESARAYFATAVEADPKAPPLWMNLATACRGLGDDEGEKAALDGALAIDLRHFTANLRMAELHQRCGQAKAAAVSWSAIVQMAATIPDPSPQVADAMKRGQRFLSDHNIQIQEKIDDELSGQLATMGSDARRFQVCLDYALRGRPIYQNHCTGIHYPFLPADEFFDRKHFPWFAAIEAKTDAIRAEALALLEKGGDAIRPYVKQEKGTPENKWSALNDSLDWSACFLWEYGERNDAVCALCPETAAALELVPQSHIPGKAPSAFFSILTPGAHIPPHTGVTNTRAIVHLPLVVPSDCLFRVGGETREWTVGEAFAFDDTIEHEAWNRSTERRIVLIFDVWNPHLTPVEQDLLTRFFDITSRQ